MFILTDAGIGVTIKNRVLSIGREQNVRSVLFWSQDELWHVGYHSTRFTDGHTENLKIATLSTPDIEVALRWLICRTANQYRTHSKRCWAQLLPLRTAGRFASGWSAEQVSVQDSHAGTVEARLIQPNGLPLHMRMTTALPHAIELAALPTSWSSLPNRYWMLISTLMAARYRCIFWNGEPQTGLWVMISTVW